MSLRRALRHNKDQALNKNQAAVGNWQLDRGGAMLSNGHVRTHRRGTAGRVTLRGRFNSRPIGRNWLMRLERLIWRKVVRTWHAAQTRTYIGL